jgi:hypothetical protein
MSLSGIDRWVGQTLFIPPIIKLCQVSGQSQFAISRLFWFIVALDQLRLADTFAEQVIAGLFSVVMMLTASLRADMPAYSMRWFRLLALALLMLDILHGIKAGQWEGVEIWLLILFAEYAATIRTIPPHEVRKAASASNSAPETR